ncbi:MAG TPA: GNAT family N-acetyltransferase [Candidatus Binatia bacterium]|nr:GNAT family N-acetyltransferase [Candidatus Binatia bacterium]
MRFTVHRHGTVDEFLAAAGSFLEAREAEHNLILGICSNVRAAPDRFVDEPPSFATVTDAAGRIVAATVRTPPHNQVLSWVETPEAVEPLVASLTGEPLPGVLGPTEPAERFARHWTDATGQPARIELAERIFRLERVIPPQRPATGSWRFGEPRDHELALRWWLAFISEAMPLGPPPRDPEQVIARWLASPNVWVYFWEDGGEPVSMVGASGETPHGVRIGPVYTPPELRGRGYASALTATASQDQLDRGRDFVFLFTDLANPTSNKIYRAIGYEPVCDVDMYRFGAEAEADP